MSYVTKDFLHQVRKQFIKTYSGYKTSHIAEALAFGYGYKSYASCLSNIKKIHQNTDSLSEELFSKKISQWYPSKNIDLANIIKNVTFLYANSEIGKKFSIIFNNAVKDKLYNISFTFRDNNVYVRYKAIDSNQNTYENSKDILSYDDMEDFKLYMSKICGVSLSEACNSVRSCDISKWIQTPYKADIRVSFALLPNNGIHISIQLLNSPYRLLPLQNMGIPEAIINGINKPGLTIVAGPTGSGKSTSLFAMLQNLLNEKNISLATYDNITEFNFNPNKGEVIQYTRPVTDYNIDEIKQKDFNNISVGNINTGELLDKVMQLSDLGYAVSSTIHAMNVSSTLDRMISLSNSDINLESIQALVSQRLTIDISGRARTGIFEYIVFNDYVKSKLSEAHHSDWNNVLKKLLKEHSGNNSHLVQCESFESAFSRAYEEGRISLETLQNNLHLSI